jgi:hypothetical protein
MRNQRKWTDRECDRLRKLCADGYTYSEAGMELDRSRNSIGGKAQSMGLKFHGMAFTRGSTHSEKVKKKISLAVRKHWDNWRTDGR